METIGISGFCPVSIGFFLTRVAAVLRNRYIGGLKQFAVDRRVNRLCRFAGIAHFFLAFHIVALYRENIVPAGRRSPRPNHPNRRQAAVEGIVMAETNDNAPAPRAGVQLRTGAPTAAFTRFIPSRSVFPFSRIKIHARKTRPDRCIDRLRRLDPVHRYPE